MSCFPSQETLSFSLVQSASSDYIDRKSATSDSGSMPPLASCSNSSVDAADYKNLHHMYPSENSEQRSSMQEPLRFIGIEPTSRISFDTVQNICRITSWPSIDYRLQALENSHQQTTNGPLESSDVHGIRRRTVTEQSVFRFSGPFSVTTRK